jgi:hypothetical protein
MLTMLEAAVQKAHTLTFAMLENSIIRRKVHKNSLQKDFCNTASDLTSTRKRRAETGTVNIFSSFP